MPAAAAALAMSACALLPAHIVTISARHLLVRDVATLDCLSASKRAEIGTRAIATIDEGQRHFPRRALRALVARRAPELSDMNLGSGDDGDLVIERPRTQKQPGHCFTAARALVADAAIDSSDVAEAACNGARPAALAYDRQTGRMSAHTAIASGTYLGSLEPAAPAPDAGAPLTLDVIAGPVHVMRQVTALQSGVRSRRIFVRDDDGAVFRVPLPRATP